MKKISVMFAFVTCVTLYAMDEEPYKPTVPMINPETGEGYFSGMPNEMKAQIIMGIETAKSLPEAVGAIRALTETNTTLHELINDVKVTRGLVNMLVAKFGGYHETVASMLKTPGAKEYIANNKKYIDQWQHMATLDAVKQLIQSGADLQFITSQGLCPLAIVINNAQLENEVKTNIVNYLIAEGASMTVIDSTGKSLLLIALYARALDIVRLLLAYDLPLSVINAQQEGKLNTVLHIAAIRGYVDIVTLLLAAGADPLIQDVLHQTAIEYAQDYIRLFPNKKTQGQAIVALLRQAAKNLAEKKQ
jgi:hypothetical protein